MNELHDDDVLDFGEDDPEADAQAEEAGWTPRRDRKPMPPAARKAFEAAQPAEPVPEEKTTRRDYGQPKPRPVGPNRGCIDENCGGEPSLQMHYRAGGELFGIYVCTCGLEYAARVKVENDTERLVVAARGAGIPERYIGLASNPQPHPHYQRLARVRDVLVLYGGSPDARTEAASCAAALAIRAGKQPRVVRGIDSRDWYRSAPAHLATDDLLVILDVDKSACDSKDDVRGPLLDLIRRRFDARRPTVITTSWEAATWARATGGAAGNGPAWWANGIDIGGAP